MFIYILFIVQIISIYILNKFFTKKLLSKIQDTNQLINEKINNIYKYIEKDNFEKFDNINKYILSYEEKINKEIYKLNNSIIEIINKLYEKNDKCIIDSQKDIESLKKIFEQKNNEIVKTILEYKEKIDSLENNININENVNMIKFDNLDKITFYLPPPPEHKVGFEFEVKDDTERTYKFIIDEINMTVEESGDRHQDKYYNCVTYCYLCSTNDNRIHEEKRKVYYIETNYQKFPPNYLYRRYVGDSCQFELYHR